MSKGASLWHYPYNNIPAFKFNAYAWAWEQVGEWMSDIEEECLCVYMCVGMCILARLFSIQQMYLLIKRLSYVFGVETTRREK